MKILLIHNFYQYRGGEDTYFLALKTLLKIKGHQVITYTKDNRNIHTLFQKLKVATSLFINRNVESEVLALIKKYNPDIAHCHNIYPLITPVVYRVCKKLRVPVVQTVNNYRLICPGGILSNNGKECIHVARKDFTLRKLFHNCYRNSYRESLAFSSALLFHKLFGSFSCIDFYLFPSLFALRVHKTFLRLPLKKTKVLPYFVNNAEKKTSSQKLGSYFLFVGRLSPEKGILPLLKIFTKLHFLKLIVIGDGPLKDEVMKFKRYPNIIIKPFLPQKEVFYYMDNAFCTIVPSAWYEVLPLVTLESFANGTPVIAPKIGVFKDIIKEWETGLLFKFNDYKNLKYKLIQAFKNKSRIKSMKGAVRAFYKQNYTADRHYSELLNVYKVLKI